MKVVRDIYLCYQDSPPSFCYLWLKLVSAFLQTQRSPVSNLCSSLAGVVFSAHRIRTSTKCKQCSRYFRTLVVISLMQPQDSWGYSLFLLQLAFLEKRKIRRTRKGVILFLSLHQNILFFPSPLNPPNQQANLG